MNTVPFKSVWVREYQNTHYKQAVFPMFADTRFEKDLVSGSNVKWSYDSDMSVGRMDSSGGYTLNGRTATDETLTVDQRPYAGFVIPTTERIQDHRPSQEKWAKKSMNVIYQDIDGVILGKLKSGATSTLSAGDFGGSSGNPITLTTSNPSDIFAAARRKLRNQNVIYDQTRKFRNVVAFDKVDKFPVAAIPAELEEKLLLQIGFKNTELGDTTLKQGYLGLVFGFNSVVSTSLPFSFRITYSTTPTDGSTLTIGSGTSTVGTGTALAFTWETGTITDAPGKVKAETSATVSVGNLVAGINGGMYTDVSGAFEAFTRADLSTAQQRIADNISAVDHEDGSATITINGQGTLSVTDSDANGTIDRQAVWAIFGTSQSIAMIMQRTPSLEISPGGLITTGQGTGYAGKQFLTWTLYGSQVFTTQAKQLVAVPIDASNFSQPSSVLN